MIAAAVFLVVKATAAAVAAEESSLFTIGDRVQTVAQTPVWVSPPLAGRFEGNQVLNATGSIVDGPVWAAEVWWWNVQFDMGPSGWIAERQIRNLNGRSAILESKPIAKAAKPASSASFLAIDPPSGSTVRSAAVTLHGEVIDSVYAPSLISFSMNGQNLALSRTGNFDLAMPLTPGLNSFTFQASTPNARQQPNQISAYLDGSVIYGSDPTRAAALRTFQGGRLKTSAGNLPPLNSAGLPNANDAHLFPDDELFLAGDVRSNENVELTAVQALFVREHNQIADAIAAAIPSLSDEQIFQGARRIVVAEFQVITYNEFLPALLGAGALRPYLGYDPNVNPEVAIEFSTAAFRIGHTLVNDAVGFRDNDGNEIQPAVPLAEAFFNPSVLETAGLDPVLKDLATDDAQEVDTQLVSGLRNFLFGPPGAGGLDLASLNIQRGRDHGVADYNSTRVAYGLPRVTSFAEITSNPDLQTKLFLLYGNVDSIDLWVGGLAEDHVSGSSMGPTFRAIIADQFERVRDGDRYWYERVFQGRQLQAIQQTRLSDIIRRNSTITKIQDNVFFFQQSTLSTLQPRPGALPADLIEKKKARFIRLAPTTASLDGTGNNQSHTTWGSAGVDLMRFVAVGYGDSISTPAGASRPSPRLISNTVCDQTADIRNARNLSSWIFAWGQFVDHDLDMTPTGNTAFDVPVPPGDPYFDPDNTGTAVIYFSRSVYDASTGTATPNVEQQAYTIMCRPKHRRHR